MVIQRKKNGIFYIALISLVLILSCLLSCLSFTPHITSAETVYSEVLEDLEKDENFDIDDYPVVEDDFSLQVIQIAESNNNELFVYVYQPSGEDKDLRATSINISTGINDNLFYVNYTLTYLSSSGTLYKYLVNDFTLLQDALRYYDISSIFRAWDEGIDGSADGDNTINEVSYEVAKLFTVSTVEGEVSYTCLATDTIVITEKYVGFIRYSNGFQLLPTSCDSHYVAFSTDKPIDKLMEADVYYVARSFETPYYFGIEKTTTYGTSIDYTVTLKYTDVASNPGDGLFGHTYTWNRIESVSEFIANENLTDETKASLTNKQWVLRFAETEFKQIIPSVGFWTYDRGTQVSEVTILRLKFETDGKVYNLGVVDNKQSGDLTPDNPPGDFWETLYLLVVGFLALVLIVVAVAVMAPTVFPAIFKFIGNCIKWLFQGLWWIISAPFSVFKKDKK